MTDPSSGLTYRTRLDVLFAAEAPVAVISRRGPRRHYRLIHWDLETDTFTPGQWMIGDVQITDLSPDGRYLLYHAMQPGRSRRQGLPGYDPLRQRVRRPRRQNRRVPRYLRDPDVNWSRSPLRPRYAIGDIWTAICRPPWFTALAVWSAHDTFEVGGIFAPDGTVLLWKPEDDLVPHFNAQRPRRLRVTSWRCDPNYADVEGPSAYAPGYSQWRTDMLAKRALEAELRDIGARWVEWFDTRDPASWLFACDGCVYRLPNGAAVAPEDRLGLATRLADFTDMTFETVAPPEVARTW